MTSGDEWTWWEDRARLARFVSDLLAGEFARIAPGRELPARPWPDAMPIGAGGLGADSLDRIKLATALGEAIHLGESKIDDTLLSDADLEQWLATVARSLRAYSATVTFATSGSTGRPQWHVHALADLNAEVALLAAGFAERRRIVCAVPSHHIYGFLFTLLLPARLRVPVIDVRAMSPASVGASLQPGDLVVAHPDFWSAFARSARPTFANVAGVTSTAPCPADVARAVVGLGIEPLVEIYGSSETAGIGRRADPAASYELFPYWQRGGTDGEVVRTMADGTQRVFALPDRVRWDDDRHLRPLGRREGAVQVAGYNVFPERVRAVLLEHPQVADAAVRLMAPHEGDRLKAFVVPASAVAESALRPDLDRWCDARLSVPERPRAFTFGDALPTNPIGKPADWPL